MLHLITYKTSAQEAYTFTHSTQFHCFQEVVKCLSNDINFTIEPKKKILNIFMADDRITKTQIK